MKNKGWGHNFGIWPAKEYHNSRQTKEWQMLVCFLDDPLQNGCLVVIIICNQGYTATTGQHFNMGNLWENTYFSQTRISFNTGNSLPICSDVKTRKRRNVVEIDMIRNNRVAVTSVVLKPFQRLHLWRQRLYCYRFFLLFNRNQVSEKLYFDDYITKCYPVNANWLLK
jgi:hypothetical protein